MSDTAPTSDTPKITRSYGAPRQKVPPFARYKGTSAWRKDRRRGREYARYLAGAKPSV